MARLVSIYKYQEIEGIEVEWKVTAQVYPGDRATRMDPGSPPEVEYIKVTAITPDEQPKPELIPIPKPIEFSPEAFEAVMRLGSDTYGFSLQDLDGDVLEAASEQAQDEWEAAADARFELRRDDEIAHGR